MLEKNKRYEMKIDDLSEKGEGVGRVGGFAVFVAGGTVGDTIEAQIVKVTKNYAYGKLIKIIDASDDRVTPVCSIYSKCGGCNMQHISYSAQLRLKTKKVREALRRIGGFENVTVENAIGMENPYNYRNKAQYPVGEKDGRIIAGFYSVNSHNIVEVTECVLQRGSNKTITAIIRKFAEDYKIPAYDECLNTGLLRHILIRTGFYTNEIIACLVINGDSLPYGDKLAKSLQGIATGLAINVNKRKTNVILGQKTVTIWGEACISDYIADLRFEISPASFFQVNPIQTKILYETALEYAGLTGSETVLDAYCGIGTIALFLARSAKRVLGIEVVTDAIRDARLNAVLNGIDNVEFIEGRAEDVLQRLGVDFDVLVVDPPRKGLALPFIESVLKRSPKKIVYISCDSATLARDLKFLREGGYFPDKVRPIDMFPMTYHVETVVLMSRKDG